MAHIEPPIERRIAGFGFLGHLRIKARLAAIGKKYWPQIRSP